MRGLVILALLALATTAAVAESVATRLRPVRLAGQDYVNLEAWASRLGFTLRDLQSGKLRLYDTNNSLTFQPNERLANVNGANIWLAFPVREYLSTLHASKLDLVNYIEPIFLPQAKKPHNTVKRVVLDPGHGGKDPGAMANGLVEKHLTLDVAMRTAQILVQNGLEVLLTRKDDRFVELDERSRLAREVRADLFISIHFNAAEQPTVRGVEVYAMPVPGAPSTAGRAIITTRFLGNRFDAWNTILAYAILQELIHRLDTTDRGLRRARFQVLRNLTMPAILVEGGFLSSPMDAKALRSTTYRAALAKAIAEGVLRYKMLVEAR